MPDVSLRPTRHQDIDHLAEVQVRSWQVGYRDLLPAGFLTGLDPAWQAQNRRSG